VSKAVVLFSGGQDSVTCLWWAKMVHDDVHAVTIEYGQRHHAEIAAAEKIAAMAGVPWSLFQFNALKEIGDSALLNKDEEIKLQGGRHDPETPQGLPTSFVPGRNIFFLGIAAAYAAKIEAEYVVGGMCDTDYSGYPDCRLDTIQSLEHTFKLGLGATPEIKLETPLMRKTKAETVALAARLPGCLDALAHSITCYNGEHPGCGTCPSCELRAKGFEEAGIPDPARR